MMDQYVMNNNISYTKYNKENCANLVACYIMEIIFILAALIKIY